MYDESDLLIFFSGYFLLWKYIFDCIEHKVFKADWTCDVYQISNSTAAIRSVLLMPKEGGRRPEREIEQVCAR